MCLYDVALLCVCYGSVMRQVMIPDFNEFYCILHGRIKGFNCSVTTILFEVGSSCYIYHSIRLLSRTFHKTGSSACIDHE